LPVALVAWLPGGPLAHDWARRAGTPLKDLQRTSATTAVARTGGAGSATTSQSAAPARVSAFTAPVTGTAVRREAGNGLVEVEIALTVGSSQLHALDVRIDGQPLAGGGVQMTSSSVSIGTAADPSRYTGAITALDGTDISARVSSPGDRGTLAVALALQIDGATGSVRGSVQVTPA